MAKLVPMLVFLYGLLITILIFDGTAGSGYYISPNNGTLYVSNNSTYNAFWDMFINPSTLADITQNQIWIVLIGIFGVVVGIAVAFFTKSDMFILWGFFILIFCAGLIPITSFWNVIHREAWAIGAGANSCPSFSLYGTENINCSLAVLAAAIVCGPLTLYWFWVCFEWLTGRVAS